MDRIAGARRRPIKRRGASSTTEALTTSVRRKPLPDRAPPYIVIADDVEDNRQLYAAYFAYAGLRVAEAADGREVLAIVAKEPPDLIVMDLAMPRVDGWEATRLIKSRARTKGIIVLVLTGHATQDEDFARARAAGADEICTKPCLPKDLLAKVLTLLGVAASR
ncbi:MAG: response regulator [Labilithrix sp.]|nr:response regulator [Labilithrix sp.]